MVPKQNPKSEKGKENQETRENNKNPEKVKTIKARIWVHFRKLPRVEGLVELLVLILLWLLSTECVPKQFPINHHHQIMLLRSSSMAIALA